MTPNMKKILKKLSQNPIKEVYVHYSTAYALQDLELVIIGKIPKKQMTTSGNFPQYIVTLTKKGRKYCEEFL